MNSGGSQINGQPAKAVREVRIGDMLRVTNNSGDFQIEVLVLSEMRGPASVAQTRSRGTEASRELRLKMTAAERKAMRQFEPLPADRPSKRDRRKIIQSGEEPERGQMTAKPQVPRQIPMFFNRAPGSEFVYGMHMLDRAQQMDAIAFVTMKGSRCEETSVALLRRSFILEVLAWSRGRHSGVR